MNQKSITSLCWQAFNLLWHIAGAWLGWKVGYAWCRRTPIDVNPPIMIFQDDEIQVAIQHILDRIRRLVQNYRETIDELEQIADQLEHFDNDSDNNDSDYESDYLDSSDDEP